MIYSHLEAGERLLLGGYHDQFQHALMATRCLGHRHPGEGSCNKAMPLDGRAEDVGGSKVQSQYITLSEAQQAGRSRVCA